MFKQQRNEAKVVDVYDSEQPCICRPARIQHKPNSGHSFKLTLE